MDDAHKLDGLEPFHIDLFLPPEFLALQGLASVARYS